jgi:transposase
MGRPSKFDMEYRAHALELVRVSKKPRCQIAADLGVSDTTLSKWMNESSKDPAKKDVLSLSERQELEQLRAEKREWIIEREILKKSTAFWVKESRG